TVNLALPWAGSSRGCRRMQRTRTVGLGEHFQVWYELDLFGFRRLGLDGTRSTVAIGVHLRCRAGRGALASRFGRCPWRLGGASSPAASTRTRTLRTAPSRGVSPHCRQRQGLDALSGRGGWVPQVQAVAAGDPVAEPVG